MSDVNQEILDKMTKVCICKAITRSTIKKLIKSGKNTLEEIQKETGVGSGACNGRRCISKILDLIEREK